MKKRKRMWYTCGVLLFCLISLPMNSDLVYAATKKIEVDIPDAYKSCTFTITCEDESGTYTASLISPNGETYKCSKVSDNKLTVNVDNVHAGTWVVKVKDKEQEEIGKVKVSVTAAAQNKTDVVDNISIAKDINGLKVYLKNDSVVAEWNDDSVGNVNVKVVNLDTAETIASQTVSEKYFECPLESTVHNISVVIVPTASAGVDGAELTYKIKNDNHPDAVITFPDCQYTNQDEVVASVSLGSDYRTMVLDNNSVIQTEEKYESGNYEYHIPIDEDGIHTIEIYIIDDDGNMRSTKTDVVKDTVSPALSLNEAYDQAEVETETFDIAGTVEDYKEIEINGEKLSPATDGHFEYTLNLHLGENHIKLSAGDEAGNVTDYEMTIIRVEPQKRNNMISYLPVLGFIIVGIGYMIKKILGALKNKKRTRETLGDALGTGTDSEDDEPEEDVYGGLPRIVLPKQGAEHEQKNKGFKRKKK